MKNGECHLWIKTTDEEEQIFQHESHEMMFFFMWRKTYSKFSFQDHAKMTIHVQVKQIKYRYRL